MRKRIKVTKLTKTVEETLKAAAAEYNTLNAFQRGVGKENIDPKCKEYNGVKVGTVAYVEFLGEASEVVVLGFSKKIPLHIVDDDTNFRRAWVAYWYKGKLQLSSQPQVLAEPVIEVEKCYVCKKRDAEPLMGGACSSRRCVMQAMRDRM